LIFETPFKMHAAFLTDWILGGKVPIFVKSPNFRKTNCGR